MKEFLLDAYDWLSEAADKFGHWCASPWGWSLVAFLAGALLVYVIWFVKHPDDFVHYTKSEDDDTQD